MSVSVFLQTPKEVGAMWTESGLDWSDFLAEDLDINKFVADQVCRLQHNKTGEYIVVSYRVSKNAPYTKHPQSSLQTKIK